ncbi:hypothetical protein AAG906_028021 [Vitis piasezkii]
MTFEEFTQKVLEKFNISLHVMRMHYTLKFNSRVIQDLEEEDDLDNVVSNSDDFANVYIVESPRVEAIEANILNTQLAFGLREINPGTIAEYTSHEGHFKQLFIAYAISIQGFIMRSLLSAIAYDADNGMFPLSLGVVGSENYED